MKSREKDFRIGCEPSDPEIVTVPDCSCTIPELLQKFTRGVLPEIGKPWYDLDPDDDITPDLEQLDVDQLDVWQMSQELGEQIEQKKALKQAKKVPESPDIKPGEEAENK